MGKLSRAPRAVTGIGRRERMLDRVGRWVRPVVVLLSVGAGAFWALELWTVWSGFGVVWAAGVTWAVLWALNIVSDGRRSLRAGQVFVLGGMLIGVAVLGTLQLWYLSGGVLLPYGLRTNNDVGALTLPTSAPPPIRSPPCTRLGCSRSSCSDRCCA